jgi:Tfp pilus tip-associated adhesin PilY1
MDTNTHRFSFTSRQQKSLLLALYLMATLFAPLGESQAANPLTLAQEPLFSASSANSPNLMFLLDSSGSMAWDFVPDYVNDTSNNATTGCFSLGTALSGVRKTCYVGDPPFMSPEFNKIYYNADYTYQPGWNGTLATPAAYGAQSITSTVLDPYGMQVADLLGKTTTPLNLTTNYPDRQWCVNTSAQSASWIQVNSVTGATTISALKIGATNVLSGTTTAASTPATVAANLVAKLLATYSANSRYTIGDTGFWLINPAVSAVTPTYTVASGAATITPTALGTYCAANTTGYTYPDSAYRNAASTGTAPSGGNTTGKYALGAPYYWRIIATEYCSDEAKTVCVDWTAADAVVSGTTYSTSKYCTAADRTFSLCQASRDSTHQYPAKCSASACVEPGQGGTYVYSGESRFCKPDATKPTTDPLIDCKGSYNSITGHVIPKFIGYVIPSAGDNAFGLITIGAVIPGQQITSITIDGGATNLLASPPYTVLAGATPNSVATALAAAISAGYTLPTSGNSIAKVAQGNVVRISSAVTGVADNDHVITVAGPAWVTDGTPANATLTVSPAAAGTLDYRLGPICVGTVAGSFPSQTCGAPGSGKIIANSTDALSVDLSSVTPGRSAAATSIALAITNAAIAGYTATAVNDVVTISAPGNDTSPINIMASSLAGGVAAGTITVYGSTAGILTYGISSIVAGATTISTGAVNGSWDLTTTTGKTAAATAIAAVIGNGYSAVANSNLVTITANTGGTSGNGLLTVNSTGTAASGSITVSNGSSGVRSYSISSITVGATTVASNINFSADTTTPAGKNSAAKAIKDAIGNGYVGSCVGGATCTDNSGKVTITATAPGGAWNGVIAVTSAPSVPLSPITLTVGGTAVNTDVSGIFMTGCGNTDLNIGSGKGILKNDPAASAAVNTVAANIKGAAIVNSGVLSGAFAMTIGTGASSNVVTFTPKASFGSQLNGCTLAVQRAAATAMTFTFSGAFAVTGRDVFAATKVDATGGKEVLPTTLSGISGGTNLLALPYSKTSFSGGTDAIGPIATITDIFSGGSAAGNDRRSEVGNFKRCDITATADCAGLGAGKFPRTANRTDCVAHPPTTPAPNTITAADLGYCTYAEESTNFANWFAFNRTRLQAMKTAAGLAFYGLPTNFRVGFATIYANSPTHVDANGQSDFLQASDFTGAQKQSWYTKFYAMEPKNSTPLRSALARIGQMYGKRGGLAAADPVQYSCQQNFVLLTTDGYWNSDSCSDVKQLDTTTDIGQQDGAPTHSQLDVASEMWDGDKGGTCLNVDGPSSTGTLADVAYYYAHTDLRTPGLTPDQCIPGAAFTPAQTDVCKNNVPHVNSSEPVFQHMSTFTLGLGVNGTLRYQSDYDTASSGDFYDIKHKITSWPQVTANDQSTVDDLWHAAVNGFGKYFSASNPTLLKSSLDNALSTIKSTIGSGAAAATSAQALTTKTQNYAYVASYQTVYWYGNLEARAIDAITAKVSPSATWCVTDVQGDLSTGASPCTGKLKGQVGASTDTRNIYLFDAANAFGNKLRPFTFGNLSGAEQGYFNPCSPAAPLTALTQCGLYSAGTATGTTATSLVDYLRGQTGQEMDSSTNTIQSFRGRRHPFGDAVGSQPVYVGLPGGSYNDTGYGDYKAAIAAAYPAGFPETVFIGTNDGMLHAFNAKDGTERWAYIPSPMLNRLRYLADSNYSAADQHKYYVNASPTVADVCFDPCGANDWHTILVGSYAGGGKGYFALDVTDPTHPVGLWEFSDANDSDIGYGYGTPVITKRPGGRWVVLLASGYDNNSGGGTGEGVIFVLSPDTGTVLTKISNNSGTTISPSGLAKIEPFVADGTHDNTSRDVYGGDLDGNLWRYRLDVGAESVVKIAQFAGPTGKVQPITTKPILTSLDDASRTRYIVVGTGQLLQTTDKNLNTAADAQSVYAFTESYDMTCDNDAVLPVTSNCLYAPRGTVIDSSGTRGNAAAVPSTKATVGHCAGATATSPPLPAACPNGAREQLLGTTLIPDGIDGLGRSLRKTSDTTIAPPLTPGVTGCYVNLPDSGERVDVQPLLIDGRIVVAGNVPESEVCSTGGHSFYNVFDYKTCKSVLSVELGSALVVGIALVRTAPSEGSPGGQDVPLFTLANNPTPETAPAVPPGSAAYQGRRLGWRLIND